MAYNGIPDYWLSTPTANAYGFGSGWGQDTLSNMGGVRQFDTSRVLPDTLNPYASLSSMSPDTLSQVTSLNGNASANLVSPSLWDSTQNLFNQLFPGKQANGTQPFSIGQAALSGLSSLGNLWMGMKQYNLAKDSLNFQKDSFAKNWEAQTKSYNSQLEDRQRARVASNATDYESVDTYMKKNRIGG